MRFKYNVCIQIWCKGSFCVEVRCSKRVFHCYNYHFDYFTNSMINVSKQPQLSHLHYTKFGTLGLINWFRHVTKLVSVILVILWMLYTCTGWQTLLSYSITLRHLPWLNLISIIDIVPYWLKLYLRVSLLLTKRLFCLHFISCDVSEKKKKKRKKTKTKNLVLTQRTFFIRLSNQ